MGNCGSSPAELPPIAAENEQQFVAASSGTARPAPAPTSSPPSVQTIGASANVVPPAVVQGVQESQHHHRRTLSMTSQVTLKEEMRRTHQRLMNATSEEVAQIIDVDLDYAAAPHNGQQQQRDSTSSGGGHAVHDVGSSVGRRTEERMSSSGSRSRNSHGTKHCSADGRVEVEFTGFGRRR